MRHLLVLVMGTIVLLVILLQSVVSTFAAAGLELIKADHESFRTVHFQSIDAAIIPWHIGLEPKPNDLPPLSLIYCCKIRISQRLFNSFLYVADIGNREIYLNPAGRSRRLQILPNDDEHVAITKAANKIDLRDR